MAHVPNEFPNKITRSRPRSAKIVAVKDEDSLSSSQDDLTAATVRYSSTSRYAPRGADDRENTKIREKLRSLSVQKRSSGPIVARPLASPQGSSSSGSVAAAPGSPRHGVNNTEESGGRRKGGGGPSSPQNSASTDRRSPSPGRSEDGLEDKIERAKRVRFYLLQQPGPYCFLVGGEYSSTTSGRYRVQVGPQTCTCSRGPHCTHLLFVMLRVLKVPENDPKLTRKSLRNYEVDALFRNYHSRKSARLKNAESAKEAEQDVNKSSQSSPQTVRCQQEDEDVCSICLFKMRDGEIFSKCNLGCQNSFHKKCISVWFDECRRQADVLKCPLCRSEWEPVSLPPPLVSQMPPTGNISAAVEAAGRRPHHHHRHHQPPVHQAGHHHHQQLEDTDYRSWVESFGLPVAENLISSTWDQREAGLRQVAQLTARAILEGKDVIGPSTAECPRLRDAFKIVCRLLDDLVYNVFVAALRAFREILGYLVCRSVEEQRCVQRLTGPVLRRLLRLSSDSQTRKAQLALSALVELARGQRGELALGWEVNKECLGVGGVDHLVSFVLMSSQFHTEHLLGRLMLLGRLLDQSELGWGQLKPALTFAARHIHPNDPTAGSTPTGYKVSRQARRVFVLAARPLLKPSDRPSLHQQQQGGPVVERLLAGFEPSLQTRMRQKLGLPPSTTPAAPGPPVPLMTRSHPAAPLVRLTPEPAYDSVAPSECPEELMCGPEETAVSFREEVMPLESAANLGGVGSLRKSAQEWSVAADEALGVAVRVQTRQNPLPIIPGLVRESEEGIGGRLARSDCYVVDEDWSRGHLLGTGAFSHCYQARDLRTGTLMAVKQIGVTRSTVTESEEVLEAVSSEVDLMSRLSHPNVARLLGAVYDSTAGLVNVFVEWMPGGSVAELLTRYGPFQEPIVLSYTLQVLRGLAYLHENHILHRDMKGANLLVNSTGTQVRISDFGASARLASHGSERGQFQGQLLGTIPFMAPEVLRGEEYGRSCDIWSVGCVVIEMITSRPPWNDKRHTNHLALMFTIASSGEPPKFPPKLSCGLSSLLEACLHPKPSARPTAASLIKHTALAPYNTVVVSDTDSADRCPATKSTQQLMPK